MLSLKSKTCSELVTERPASHKYKQFQTVVPNKIVNYLVYTALKGAHKKTRNVISAVGKLLKQQTKIRRADNLSIVKKHSRSTLPIQFL